jgi:hypothetical protein
MAKIQEKLKESLEKQSNMKSMDRLAKTLGTSLSDGVAAVNSDTTTTMELDNTSDNNSSKNAIDACDAMTPKIAFVVEEKEQGEQQESSPSRAAQSFKGENKAVVRGKKWKKNKLAIASLQKKQAAPSAGTSGSSSVGHGSSSRRPKPRFFCQF